MGLGDGSWRCFPAFCRLDHTVTGRNARGARVEITIAPNALAQDGFSCGMNRSYAKKYARNGVQRTVKRSG